MNNSFKNLVKAKLPAVISELIGVSKDQVVIRGPLGKDAPDALIKAGGYIFIAAIKSSTATASMLMAVSQIKESRRNLSKDVIPLIVVPYMSPPGREWCKKAGVAWLDLSGNANIEVTGLVVRIEGKPNLFKKVGRPANVFAPKSSRIARQLLMDPNRSYSQRELSRATGLDEGFTSRIVRKLEEGKLITRVGSGAVRVSDPELFLDSWREAYDFTRHTIIKGHIAARSGDELLHHLAKVLEKNHIKYAATGLGAAWLLTHFSGFRIATVYLPLLPEDDLLNKLAFRIEERGPNTWLVVPKDEGVFQGSQTHGDIRCVHPVQVYLDLKGHPERASEAAAKLREEYLRWR